MAATNETSSPERNRGWYQEDLTEINAPMHELLVKYSKIPTTQVITHVNDIRAKGFQANPYPCIGLYRFTILTLITHPLYDEIVQRLKSPGALYLDIGCCFGQDLRRLVLDGVPSENLVGLDIAGPLMDLGKDLFLDGQTLRSSFVVADVFKGAAQGPAWTQLERGGFDVIHCSAFFHLFPLQDQITAAKKITGLVRKGGIIVGRQVGSVQPGDVPAIDDGSLSFRHDIESLSDMWVEVGEATGTKWEVVGSMDMVGINPNSPVEDVNSRRLLFTITRIL
ncbi:hypothetical protein QQS21_009202 [Conoideocrella luteorostrata]|uniref:Methyltransferase domain-containing protein n=1 Tax=Conoideocrella luteorostrata TaxID=1105319 RepID=A0AAJ0FQN0_9HYPO|nr:hypothetical protein QQS21_009202 [Conoideocrella luteorostrata]